MRDGQAVASDIFCKEEEINGVVEEVGSIEYTQVGVHTHLVDYHLFISITR